jgi:hypothetical protein
MLKKCLLALCVLAAINFHLNAQIGFSFSLIDTSGPSIGEIAISGDYHISGGNYFELGLSVGSLYAMNSISIEDRSSLSYCYYLTPKMSSYMNIFETDWGRTLIGIGICGDILLNPNSSNYNIYTLFKDYIYLDIGLQQKFKLTKKADFSLGFFAKLVGYSYSDEIIGIWNRPSISSYFAISFY